MRKVFVRSRVTSMPWPLNTEARRASDPLGLGGLGPGRFVGPEDLLMAEIHLIGAVPVHHLDHGGLGLRRGYLDPPPRVHGRQDRRVSTGCVHALTCTYLDASTECLRHVHGSCLRHQREGVSTGCVHGAVAALDTWCRLGLMLKTRRRRATRSQRAPRTALRRFRLRCHHPARRTAVPR